MALKITHSGHTSATSNGSTFDYQFNGILTDWNSDGETKEDRKEGYENCTALAKALGQDKSAKYVREDWADKTFSKSSTIRH